MPFDLIAVATFGEVFGLGFTLEGFSFFLEAIFIGIYLYGWDRLSPRMHLRSGVPVVVAAITGSLTVITVNAWMNHPGGCRFEGGEAVDVRPWEALFGNSPRPYGVGRGRWRPRRVVDVAGPSLWSGAV